MLPVSRRKQREALVCVDALAANNDPEEVICLLNPYLPTSGTQYVSLRDLAALKRFILAKIDCSANGSDVTRYEQLLEELSLRFVERLIESIPRDSEKRLAVRMLEILKEAARKPRGRAATV